MQWLIDGHNLIGQMSDLRLDEAHDEEKLVGYLSRYRARTGHKVTVFFDAGPVYRPSKPQKQRGITVRFAPQGKTADQLIMHRLRKVRNPQAVAVVTSDRAIQKAARLAQVRIVSAPDFAEQLQSLSTAVAEEDQANLKLSADEVEAWLKIFEQKNDD